jgi:hypothetical protein
VNHFKTRVLSVQFLGSFTRLLLSLPGAPGTTLECDVAAGAFALLEAGEGADLTLGLKPEALRVFPAETS